MACTFYTKKNATGTVPLFVRIQSRTEKKDIRLSTNLLVDASEWEKGNSSVEKLKKYRSRKSALFEKIDKIDMALMSLLNSGRLDSKSAKERINAIVYAEEMAEEEEMRKKKEEEERAAKKVDLNTYIQKYIEEMKTGVRKTEKGLQYSDGTIKNRTSFYSEFQKFQQSRHKKYNFEDINIDFYNEFVDYFNHKNYSPNTTGKHIKSLKVIMSAARDEGLHENLQTTQRAFKNLSSEADTVYLTKKEVEAIENLDLSKQKDLDICRDVFLVGIYIAQRYSDYHRIKKPNIVLLDDGVKAVSLTQQKTGTKVVIPCSEKLLLILSKYGYNLPKTYSQLMNGNIKVVCRMAGIVQKVEHKEIKGAKKVTTLIEKYKLISTHTARRTGATLMYLDGLDPLSIMKITGHRTEKEFLKYIRVGAEENASRISSSAYFR